MNAVEHRQHEADNLWFLNSWVIVRRASSAGPDGVSIIEHHLAYGDSAPLHVHHLEDEVFHILEGSMRFRVGGCEQIASGAGATIVAPKGVPHTYRVESASGARCLTLVTGPGFEGLVRAVGRPATASALPEPITPTQDMIETLVRAAAHNGIDIIGPPLS